MSELMRPMPFGELMNWLLTEYKNSGTIFGVYEIYRHASEKRLPIFGEKIETPFGPAAGPHTQLAQNIIAAYAGGSRFFEVKTVQVMDGAALSACVARPCILAGDEGYNVEWSTELYVPQAFDEYVKAWFALKLISRALALGSPEGFVFNMSVGYDLAGIKSEKIDKYIEGMKHAAGSGIWEECLRWAKENIGRLENVDEAYVDGISPKVCGSITLSTLHGCPPDEIERIAGYLINEKGLHTYVKCNPTLLGYEFARKTMDDMGYDYLVFDDHHFNNDLQYGDAVPMFKRLLGQAAAKNVEFGVKLTNTFPVKIARNELPGEEMYMSGKSLYPLSISLAEKLEKDFGGKLRVSYSGGADYFNIGGIFDCGVWPITMATTLLKTGGYNRQKQIAERLVSMPYAPFAGVNVEKLSRLSAGAKKDVHHVKPAKLPEHIKTDGKAPLIDCFIAGCEEACPIHQDIPEYLRLVGEGWYAEALAVICEKNPLPFITGNICSHRCQSACARNFYEEPVHIREMKLKAARGGFKAFMETLSPPDIDRKPTVAIVGGGPAGMAAAYFAARAGAFATIFEKRKSLGGVVRHVIPDFRISSEAIDCDDEMLRRLGVEVKLETEITSAGQLRAQGYDHIIVAVGAWKHGALPLSEGEAMNVMTFLETAKKHPERLSLGRNVAVIGGGNTAMDAARAAKRLPGVDNVYIVYRRRVRQMPADLEELALALEDGVKFMELSSPVSFKDGTLLCGIMKLGGPDESGRQRPIATGDTIEIQADTVISAIGEQVDEELITQFGDAIVIGDARRGPATVVEAIADASEAIEELFGAKPASKAMESGPDELKARRGILRHSGPDCESGRCLGCSVICESCVDVCPNRANVVISLGGREQVLHIDRLCNECGNCTAFCPYGGEPYHDKLTLFSEREDFEESKQNQGFLPLGGGKYRVRLGGAVFEAGVSDKRIPADIAAVMSTMAEKYSYIR